jgi:protein gp37
MTANGTTTTAGTDAAGSALVVLDCPRTVAVYSAADLSSKTITVSGYDQYGQAMSQTITAPNATTVQTTKTFKSIKSVVSSGSIASNVYVGIGTGIGLPFRCTDLGYVLRVVYNQAAITIDSTACKVADTTSPATVSTTDVRGYIVTGQTDGSKRLVVAYVLPALAAGPNATRIGAVGTTQA